jgi:hypothetical protein
VEYEAKIAALERMIGRQALEIEFLKDVPISGTPLSRPGNARRPGAIPDVDAEKSR